MYFSCVYARDISHAWKSIALLLLCLCGGVAWASGPQSTHGAAVNNNVVVTVNPDATWQSAYPSCSVHATADEYGDKPDVTITGPVDCYTTEGTVDIAIVIVTDATVPGSLSYLVQVVDGQVLIVLIDPE